MKRVLITGAHGQLGRCLRDASERFVDFECTFVTKEQLDICASESLSAYFKKYTFDYCINTAAYTHVEKAEAETKEAFSINAEAVATLSEVCKINQVVLLHISTDYVFDGTKRSPYLETDSTSPVNVYGASKLKGEQQIAEILEEHYIIRTSWLYSQYRKNFYTSMLRFAEEKRELSITTAETGTPTNANDLAEICFQMLQKNPKYGIYNFSNTGEATWYDFAAAIFKYHGISSSVSLHKTDFFKTEAKRPAYSVLNTHKISQALSININNWEESLKALIEKV
ncbi:dTDP-4-dehydrorhamnose reductase [Jejudonia soesokkakensis]|uniref:dTDP-4-dehydrorhamnose reductase n=1 Tax=Jejudonia soesokkakensis TaxID=1323432 RepID=A0ABW2MRL8_9FLAO